MAAQGKSGLGAGSEGVGQFSVTPERADLWLTTRKFARQRRLRTHVAARYGREMTAGTFVPGSLIRFGVLAGKVYLLNGLHRLTAVVESGTTQEFMLQYTDVATEAELDRLYGVIDSGLNRTIADSLVAHADVGATGLNKADINNLAAAVRIIHQDFDGIEVLGGVLSRAEIHELVMAWAPEMWLYREATKHAAKYLTRPIRRGGLVAVALVAFRYVPESAALFFGQVAEDNGLTRGTPEKVLTSFLLETGQGVDRVYKRGQEHASKAKTARITAACWNGASEGRTMKIRPHIYDETKPIVIAGTPYDGKAK